MSLALVRDPGTDETAVALDHRVVLVRREGRAHSIHQQPVELRPAEVLDSDLVESTELLRTELLVFRDLQERVRERAVVLELLLVRELVAVADRKVVAR